MICVSDVSSDVRVYRLDNLIIIEIHLSHHFRLIGTASLIIASPISIIFEYLFKTIHKKKQAIDDILTRHNIQILQNQSQSGSDSDYRPGIPLSRSHTNYDRLASTSSCGSNPEEVKFPQSPTERTALTLTKEAFVMDDETAAILSRYNNNDDMSDLIDDNNDQLEDEAADILARYNGVNLEDQAVDEDGVASVGESGLGSELNGNTPRSDTSLLQPTEDSDHVSLAELNVNNNAGSDDTDEPEDTPVSGSGVTGLASLKAKAKAAKKSLKAHLKAKKQTSNETEDTSDGSPENMTEEVDEVQDNDTHPNTEGSSNSSLGLTGLASLKAKAMAAKKNMKAHLKAKKQVVSEAGDTNETEVGASNENTPGAEAEDNSGTDPRDENTSTNGLGLTGLASLKAKAKMAKKNIKAMLKTRKQTEGGRDEVGLEQEDPVHSNAASQGIAGFILDAVTTKSIKRHDEDSKESIATDVIDSDETAETLASDMAGNGQLMVDPNHNDNVVFDPYKEEGFFKDAMDDFTPYVFGELDLINDPTPLGDIPTPQTILSPASTVLDMLTSDHTQLSMMNDTQVLSDGIPSPLYTEFNNDKENTEDVTVQDGPPIANDNIVFDPYKEEGIVKDSVDDITPYVSGELDLINDPTPLGDIPTPEIILSPASTVLDMLTSDHTQLLMMNDTQLLSNGIPSPLYTEFNIDKENTEDFTAQNGPPIAIDTEVLSSSFTGSLFALNPMERGNTDPFDVSQPWLPTENENENTDDVAVQASPTMEYDTEVISRSLTNALFAVNPIEREKTDPFDVSQPWLPTENWTEDVSGGLTSSFAADTIEKENMDPFDISHPEPLTENNTMAQSSITLASSFTTEKESSNVVDLGQSWPQTKKETTVLSLSITASMYTTNNTGIHTHHLQPPAGLPAIESPRDDSTDAFANSLSAALYAEIVAQPGIAAEEACLSTSLYEEIEHEIPVPKEHYKEPIVSGTMNTSELPDIDIYDEYGDFTEPPGINNLGNMSRRQSTIIAELDPGYTLETHPTGNVGLLSPDGEEEEDEDGDAVLARYGMKPASRRRVSGISAVMQIANAEHNDDNYTAGIEVRVI